MEHVSEIARVDLENGGDEDKFIRLSLSNFLRFLSPLFVRDSITMARLSIVIMSKKTNAHSPC